MSGIHAFGDRSLIGCLFCRVIGALSEETRKRSYWASNCGTQAHAVNDSVLNTFSHQ